MVTCKTNKQRVYLSMSPDCIKVNELISVDKEIEECETV